MTRRTSPEKADGPGGREHPFDVMVIGAGTAGLSAALTLTRARRSVLVVDNGAPRNALAAHAHGYLTRDGTPPQEILAAGRREVADYGGEFLEGTAESAELLTTGGVRVQLKGGAQAEAKRLLVTTGLVDELPAVPGLRERWGQDVLHCPYCHGWEVRDQPVGVLATGPLGAHQALLWRQWSADLTLFTHTSPEPDADEREQLAARGIRLVSGTVAEIAQTDGKLSGVRMTDGRIIPVRALAVAPQLIARSGPLESLGLRAEPMEMNGHVIGWRMPSDARGATDVAGVFVAGNVTNLTEQLVGAASAGVLVGAAINLDLIGEETRLAVAASRGAAGSNGT